MKTCEFCEGDCLKTTASLVGNANLGGQSIRVSIKVRVSSLQEITYMCMDCFVKRIRVRLDWGMEGVEMQKLWGVIGEGG